MSEPTQEQRLVERNLEIALDDERQFTEEELLEYIKSELANSVEKDVLPNIKIKLSTWRFSWDYDNDRGAMPCLKITWKSPETDAERIQRELKINQALQRKKEQVAYLQNEIQQLELAEQATKQSPE